MKCDFIDNKSEKKHLRDDNSMNRVFLQSNKAIEVEAGDVIRVGFDFFYPTGISQAVLRQFMKTMCQIMSLNAVMDRLSENMVVSHLLQNILPDDLTYIHPSNMKMHDNNAYEWFSTWQFDS